MSEQIFDPYDREQQIEPYALYRHLRDHEPLQRNEKRGFWVLSRHEDVLATFLDPTTFSSAKGSFPDDDSARVGRTLGSTDPPRHDRLRKLASSAFTPRRIASIAPVIRDFVEEGLAPVKDGEAIDVPTEFATPLTSGVISTILGVPKSDVPMMQKWSSESFRLDSTREDGTAGQREALGNLLGYLAEAAALRRRDPDKHDDLLAGIVRAEIDGDRLTDHEVSWLAQAFFTAGYETTASSIANGVALLAANPEERWKLDRDPALIAGAVEEMLRMDSPAQGFRRTVARTVELYGQRLDVGENVIILPASANRDDRVFADPDRLDVTRSTRQHLAFGHGIHFCIGAPLSRLENRIVFEMLLEAYGDWTVDPAQCERSFAGRFMLRGFAHLGVQFHKR